VTVNRLFRNLPVRKNYLNSGRRAAEELKRADNIAKSLAVIHPGLRVTFCHNKCLLWQKAACTSLHQSLMQVLGYLISSNLEELVLRESEASVLILLLSTFWNLKVILLFISITEYWSNPLAFVWALKPNTYLLRYLKYLKAKLSRSAITTAWHVFRLWIEEAASSCGG
jgi:DNA mismatch repair ATPase MutL